MRKGTEVCGMMYLNCVWSL